MLRTRIAAVTLTSTLMSLSVACVDFDAAHQRCIEQRGCVEALIPPTVVSSVPASGAVGVPVQTSLVITFSLPMDISSVEVTVNPQAVRATTTWSDDATEVTIALAEPLQHAREYVLTVTGRSAEGAQLQPVEIRFTTEQAVDVTPPTLSATTPANGASMIPVGARLSVTFSEAMDPATVSLMADPTYDFGQPSWSADQLTATFNAAPAPFSPLTTYVVTIMGRDLAGNALAGLNSITFSTAQLPDTTPPLVVSTVPMADAMNVAVDVVPAISFSEPMDPVSTRDAFSITPAVPGGCTLAFDASGTTLSCQHAQPLAGDTAYTVTIADSAHDVSGNALGQAYAWTFTTRDTTPPAIVSFTPAEASNNHEPTTAITVTFSEPMDRQATQGAFEVTSPAGAPGSFVWNAESTVLTFTPSGWPNDVVVQWQVGASAKDLAGNPLGTVVSHQFKVRGLYNVVIPFHEDGYVRQDGLFQTNSYTSVGWLKGSMTTAVRLRGLFSFDLPSNFANVASPSDVTATLRIHLNNANTGTHATYGNIVLEGVDYGFMDASDFNRLPYCLTCLPVTVSTSDTPGQRAANISEWVYAAKSLGLTRVGMRLRLGNEGSTPPSADRYARFDPIENNPNPPTRPEVELVYRVP